MRHLGLIGALVLLLVFPACRSVSVGADNRYGRTEGAAVLNFPLGVKSKSNAPEFYDAMLITGQVVSVHDGNTITVQLDDRKEKVRLTGIDAPELGQAPWGEHSRDALKELVDGKTVRLETDVTVQDQYGRLLAYVYVGETFVNLELVRQGQAVLYTVPPNVAHVEEYRKAQTEAREAGRGVWNTAQPLDVTPDCYRKQKKGREC
jgi:micrococcal nuclease